MVKINWTPIIVAIIVVIGLGAVAGVYFMSKSSERTVSATGNSQMSVLPDKAIVYLMITTKNASADGARESNALVSQKVMDALKAIGISASDIETENYNINPEYDWSYGKQTLLGYAANNNIKVSSTDFTNVGKIVDASVSSGALVSYINFDLSNSRQNEYKAQALEAASQDAKAKAEAVASGLGKKLGALVSVSASDYNYFPYPLYRAESAGAADVKQVATNISPQKLEITGTVSVTYAIK